MAFLCTALQPEITKQDAKKFQEKPGFQMENYPEIHRNPGSPGHVLGWRGWITRTPISRGLKIIALPTEFYGDGVVCPWNCWFEARKYGFGKDRDRNQEEL